MSVRHLAPVVVGSALALGLLGCPPATEVAEPEPLEGSALGVPDPEPEPDITVSAGFVGLDVTGNAQPLRDAEGLGPECYGRIGNEPDLLLEVDSPQTLTFRARPRGTGIMDLSLVVVAPDGTVACADDGDTLDPELAMNLEAGRFAIYVGAAADTVIPFTLDILPGVQRREPLRIGSGFPPPIEDGATAELTEEGTYGGARIPDDTAMVVLEGTAGGTREAIEYDFNCAGYVAQTPDHVLEVLSPEELTIRVESEGDTTMVIETPDSVALCRDDEEGLDPAIRQIFMPGTYRVFVGTYEEGDAIDYELIVSR